VVEDHSDAKPLVWPMPLLIGWGVACVSVPWLHLHAVAVIYQGVGVGFTFLGLAVIGERFRHVKEVAVVRFAKARSRLKAWSAGRREQIAIAWARLMRKPGPAIIRAATATARASASGDVSVKVTRQRVDRDTISDRDWPFQNVALDEMHASRAEAVTETGDAPATGPMRHARPASRVCLISRTEAAAWLAAV
jgi:hypothetical protein